ncbi:bacterioferritin-associated ferredoxin [Alteromonas sp. H39]|uniref:(2Fe-2S)-binding protein n=1 Tax=Alteromonas sp. H39 TaxID=3389876 RepID=UPI0039E0B0E0
MASYGVIFGDPSYVSTLGEPWHYWLKIPAENGAMMDLADPRPLDEMTASLLCNINTHLHCTTYQSSEKATLVLMREEQPVAVILLSAMPFDVPLAWLDAMFAGTTALSAEQLHGLLHHRPDDVFLSGPVVCSCYSIRELPIKNAIRDGCDSVSKLGRSLKCGTNCGSCKTELSRLIEAETRAVTTA